MKRSIVWFKTDLRLTDNETLVRAMAASDEVIPVFCLDERLLKEEFMGFKRIGSFRLKFLLESIADLDSSLRKLGSGLIFRIGKPDEVLPELARQYGVTKVFAKKEVAIEEKTIQASLEKALWKQNCVLEDFSTSTLYHALDLPFGIKDIPESFSSFRKRIEKESPIRTCIETPQEIKSPNIPVLHMPSLTELGFEETINDSRAVLNFVGGESEALKRLEHYFFESQSLSRYKETRNELIGADYSSKFSPWLAQGCVSARFIYAQVKLYEEKYGANDSTYWLIFELLWRDFFRFMMKKHGARLFHFKGFNGLVPPGSSREHALLEPWINGTTGDAFVDANMRELKQTGFMSNRGRQNVASYLIDQLQLDWRLGAAYFEEQLIDYDVSSNWGNWAYLAGVGNDPRGKRIFDTQKQAEIYDSQKQYRMKWMA